MNKSEFIIRLSERLGCDTRHSTEITNAVFGLVKDTMEATPSSYIPGLGGFLPSADGTTRFLPGPWKRRSISTMPVAAPTVTRRKTCQFCGKEYTAVRPKVQKYCSAVCRSKAYIAAYIEAERSSRELRREA